jgi:hypothetical protein
MPGFDGTGPSGEGPMTGGGFGYCRPGRRSAYGPGSASFGGRFGARRGFSGFGRGLGRIYFNRMPAYINRQSRTSAANTELAMLQQEAEDVSAHLKDVEARISQLEDRSE